jgi:hypothetical protein
MYSGFDKMVTELISSMENPNSFNGKMRDENIFNINCTIYIGYYV